MSTVPKTSLGWYMLGEKLIKYMCEQVSCGNSPEESLCKQCLLNTLSENLKFHYELGTGFHMKLVYYWRGAHKELIEKAKERLKERGLYKA